MVLLCGIRAGEKGKSDFNPALPPDWRERDPAYCRRKGKEGVRRAIGGTPSRCPRRKQFPPSLIRIRIRARPCSTLRFRSSVDGGVDPSLRRSCEELWRPRELRKAATWLVKMKKQVFPGSKKKGRRGCLRADGKKERPKRAYLVETRLRVGVSFEISPKTVIFWGKVATAFVRRTCARQNRHEGTEPQSFQ